MKRKKFTEEQICRILREVDAVGNIREVCRQYNVTEQAFYGLRNKIGLLEVFCAKKLRGRGKENAQLEKLVVELTLDKQMLQDVLSKE